MRRTAMRVLRFLEVPPSSRTAAAQGWEPIVIPRSVRKELFFDAPDSGQTLRDMFGDVRMLCHDVG
jgi:hypothetical protein